MIPRDGEKGGALIESIIILPALIYFAIFTFDLGNLLLHHAVASQIAREGVRYGGFLNDTPSLIQYKVQSRVANQLAMTGNGTSLLFSSAGLTSTTTVSGQQVGVVIAGTYKGILPPFTAMPIHVTATGPRM
jgi:hypothetical protein